MLRKIRQHHSKARRTAKKDAQSPGGQRRKALAAKQKMADAPLAIPNDWPFKQELLAEMEAKRAKEEAAMEAKREAAKEARRERRAAARAAAEAGDTVAAEGDEDEDMGGGGGEGQEQRRLAGFAAAATRRGAAHEAVAADAAAEQGSRRERVRDGSRRAFYREFQRVVEASDVVLEVIDARDPVGSRCKEVEEYVRMVGGAEKRLVLVLNKVDLVPREVAQRWLAHLREELPAVAFKCSTQLKGDRMSGSWRGSGVRWGKHVRRGREREKTADEIEAEHQAATCLGSETLMHLLKNYARNKNLKTAITVGCVGFPNVGKSSLVNSLKRKTVANAGATPGVTRATQEIHLDRHVKLIDSPGIVFADYGGGAGAEARAALRNCVRMEQLSDPAGAVAEICRRCPHERLMQIYKTPAFANADEFLAGVARGRGKLRRGGAIDREAAARTVLQDWASGAIPYYTLPPTRAPDAPVAAPAGKAAAGAGDAIVSDWSREFDAEAVFAHEQSAVIEGLPTAQEAARRRAAAFTELPTTEESTRADVSRMGLALTPAMQEDMMADDDSFSRGKKAAEARAAAAAEDERRRMYAADGQTDPRAARSAKRESKRGKKQRVEEAMQRMEEQMRRGDDDDSGSDFDFGALSDGDGDADMGDA